MDPKDLEKYSKKYNVDNELEELENEIYNEENKPSSKNKLDAEQIDNQYKSLEEEIENDEKEIKKKPIIDLYSESTEEIYHNPKKIKSLSSLELEQSYCSKIIHRKEKNSIPCDYWQKKKQIVSNEIRRIKKLIESKQINLDDYITIIKTQKDYETNLLSKAKSDTNLTYNELNEILNRINGRINKINSELEEQSEIINEEEQLEVDIYNENIENYFHNAKYMKSLSVLEKEVELCDNIINLKNKNNTNCDLWVNKRNQLDNENKRIRDLVTNEKLSLEKYLDVIKKQKEYELGLINKAETITQLTKEQKDDIIKRVNERINLIDQELNEQL